ncbi:hypothetical protein [Aurantimonas sp. VKM B-3413]|uniref:hypothetical protein n=1 Tax=Aurantimonas sp. VKM B-3413 TaxID=2779401 RepID=UPI001E5D0631|nr:hypothetical protein [Aurantimonas sp. VKM B-3413]MCB8836164.1 hypothetical protein [Aurantimonas sp. VKM B-3413]
MPDQPDDLTLLRKAHYSLEDLPETICAPQHPDHEAGVPMPLAVATLDDIAFAIVASERESMAAYRRSNALQRLYKLAREAGGIGADRAVATVIKRESR